MLPLLILSLSALFSGSAFAETVRKVHSIVVIEDNAPLVRSHPIGPSPNLEEPLNRAPETRELLGALHSRNDSLQPVARIYEAVARSLELQSGEDPGFCFDLEVEKGSGAFRISIPTDRAFEIGKSSWTREGQLAWSHARKALSSISKALQELHHSAEPIEWDIEGFADGLPFLSSGERKVFFDRARPFQLDSGRITRDLEAQEALARSRAESFRVPIENPEEGLLESVRVGRILGRNSAELEWNASLWEPMNRAAPAAWSYFGEPSLLACKTRRKIKFSSRGSLALIPVVKTVPGIDGSIPPMETTMEAALLSVPPHFLDRAPLLKARKDLASAMDAEILREGAGASSSRVIAALQSAGVLSSEGSDGYFTRVLEAFVESRIEAATRGSDMGLIDWIGRKLSSFERTALLMVKPVDSKTLEGVTDLLALYRVRDGDFRHYGEERKPGSWILESYPGMRTEEGVMLEIPDGQYRCSRCGSGVSLEGGVLHAESRLIDAPDVVLDSVRSLVRRDPTALASLLNPSVFWVGDCDSGCTTCSGMPVDEAIQKARAGEDLTIPFASADPAITGKNRSRLIPLSEFQKGCVVTRRVMESCNVEAGEKTKSPEFRVELTKITTPSEVTHTPATSAREFDSDPLLRAINALRCSGSPERALPTEDAHADCHLDAWRPDRSNSSTKSISESVL